MYKGNTLQFNCIGVTLFFFMRLKRGMGKKSINFGTLNEAIDVYGRENLIPIDNLKQAIFYVKQGCQPRFVWEKENSPGKITFWFLKSETAYVYQKWLDTCPRKH